LKSLQLLINAYYRSTKWERPILDTSN
jgi:hypothetical protein